MSLATGTRLGPYEILSALGAGGMGEVYRAKDTKLKRDVAVKVLPDFLASDPDRLARFHREAEVLATLNHPNIAHIYGFEDSDGTHALVMELVEGPTLADRIATGAIPLNDALPIAKQIAEALEAAHEQGIIHRDLKPANIKVREDGTVKVLDFGLAKLVDPVTSAPNVNVTASPTITSPAMMTGVGVILGTAAYMSPEQAAGKPVDKRSDLWAFGVVLLEMLTGRPVFDGETVSHVLAAVLTKDPDWSQLPPTTPASIRRLLRRCLEKDRKGRLDSAANARLEIDDALMSRDGEESRAAHVSSPARLPLGWIAACVMLIPTIALAWRMTREPVSVAPAVTRMVVPITDPVRFDSTDGSAIAISPDGNRIVYVGKVRDTTQLFSRRLDEFATSPIPGTEGASSPFFSPDGRWLGFRSAGVLSKVQAAGGAVIPICRTSSPLRGAAWAADDTIYFAAAGGGPLQRVPAAGGTPQPATHISETEVLHRWPQLLPGGKTILYTALTGVGFESATVITERLDTGDKHVVFRGGSAARYMDPGYLVVARSGGLFAVPFEAATLRAGTTPIQVVPGVQANLAPLSTGGAEYAVSSNGMLVYAPGSSQVGDVSLVWVDRQGVETLARAMPGRFTNVALSPDGTKAALTVTSSTTSDIWIYDFARETTSRLTFDEANDNPLWTPDGTRVAYRKLRQAKAGARGDIFWRLADGSGSEEMLTNENSHLHLLDSWSEDGRRMLLTVTGVGTGSQLITLDRTTGKETLITDVGATAGGGARLSWDAKWLAYSSSLTTEMFIQPFPSLNGRWQVSSDGGVQPRWRRDGKEVFFASRSCCAFMAAAVSASGPSLVVSKAVTLFSGPYTRVGNGWDVSADGQRFLMLKPIGQENAITQLNVILNWEQELRRLVPTK